jgi:hypothetical protein
LHAVSAFIPSPALENVVIDASFIYQDVLCKLCGVIVEEVAQSVDRFGDGGSEERVLLW